MFPDKFKPIDLADVVGHDQIVSALLKFKKSKEIPNLMFIGQPGTGKTTLAQLFIKYLHKDSYKLNYMEINASDDNGIDVIRGKVKDFASKKSIGSEFPKVIFLDEIDKLTNPAQEALKKPMEAFSKTARFILCSNSDNIHDALKSRCIVFRFNKLKNDDIKARLHQVIDNNEINFKGNIDDVVLKSNGDLRQALNLFHASISGIEIDNNLQNYELLKLTQEKFISEILFQFDPKSIIEKLFNEVILIKNNIEAIKILAESDYRMSFQTVKTLQVLDCFLQVRNN
jgi:replication factor C small subunit